jgi:hypothetical protein
VGQRKKITKIQIKKNPFWGWMIFEKKLKEKRVLSIATNAKNFENL